MHPQKGPYLLCLSMSTPMLHDGHTVGGLSHEGFVHDDDRSATTA